MTITPLFINMSLLDLFKKSKLKVNTPPGSKPSPYQDSIVKMRNVKFPPNLAPESGFDQYIRFEETGATAGSPAPVFITDFLVTQDDNFLMTEDNNNLITNSEII